jgi:hypothetical protein
MAIVDHMVKRGAGNLYEIISTVAMKALWRVFTRIWYGRFFSEEEV